MQKIRDVDEADMQGVELSIDFTPPTDSSDELWLPVSVLPKWPPIAEFDFHDAEGLPVPLLTSTQNGFADAALLSETLDRIGLRSGTEIDEIRDLLLRIAIGEETHLEERYFEFDDRFRALLLASSEDATLNVDLALAARLIDLAAILVPNSILWFPAERTQPGQRTICKVRYARWDDTSRASGQSIGDRLLFSFALYSPPEYVGLDHLGIDATFHLEYLGPPGLRIQESEAIFLFESDPALLPKQGEETKKIDDSGVVASAEAANRRPETMSIANDRRLKLYVSGERPALGFLEIVRAPPREGLITTSWLLTWFIALVAIGFYVCRDLLLEDRDLDGAVALLALVPGLLSYVAVRGRDQPVTRRYMGGLQAVLVLDALIPVGMAFTLLLFDHDPRALESSWFWLMVASLFPVCLTWAALMKSVPRSGPTKN